MESGNGIPYVITNICIYEILPVFFLHYMCIHIISEIFIYYLYKYCVMRYLYLYMQRIYVTFMDFKQKTNL